MDRHDLTNTTWDKTG